jgi:hypothetical protein
MPPMFACGHPFDLLTCLHHVDEPTLPTPSWVIWRVSCGKCHREGWLRVDPFARMTSSGLYPTLDDLGFRKAS